jgi:RNA-directed DNA polymerase
MIQTKSYEISKRLIDEAYKRVKANKGGSGVDGQSLKEFERDLGNNLYQLWNRLSSGSYFPSPVKRVDIPKADGGIRPLGIPTVADRIAQMAVKMEIEPKLDQCFHSDSFGYRPNKSAHQAIEQVKERCYRQAWVLDIDIKGFFDTIDHTLLLKAVDKHVETNWHRLYIRRWLTAPVQYPDGRLEARNLGTPQGGVISPILANLFLHYAFDEWLSRHWPDIQFTRYADDIVCHCQTENQAQALRLSIDHRFTAIGLTLHPEKTKIVYCKRVGRQAEYGNICFDFLGHTFRPRLVTCSDGKLRVYFLPAISQKAAKRIRDEINAWPWLAWTQKQIKDIIRYCQSRLRGWMAYYGRYGGYRMKHVLFHFDRKLSRWAKRKYKEIRSIAQAAKRVNAFKARNPGLLAHW